MYYLLHQMSVSLHVFSVVLCLVPWILSMVWNFQAFCESIWNHVLFCITRCFFSLHVIDLASCKRSKSAFKVPLKVSSAPSLLNSKRTSYLFGITLALSPCDQVKVVIHHYFVLFPYPGKLGNCVTKHVYYEIICKNGFLQLELHPCLNPLQSERLH